MEIHRGIRESGFGNRVSHNFFVPVAHRRSNAIPHAPVDIQMPTVGFLRFSAPFAISCGECFNQFY